MKLANMALVSTMAVFGLVAVGCASKTDSGESLGTTESQLVEDGAEADDADESMESGIEEPLSGADPSDPGTPADGADDAALLGKIKTNPGKWFQPAGCITTTLAGNVATHVFKDCTGPYGFVNFNSDPLLISYRIAEADFKQYQETYGYSPEVVKAFRVQRDAALGAAFRAANASSKTQAQLDAAAAAIERTYDRKLREYLAARGFDLESGNLTRIDMPGIVRRNGPLVKPLAETFDRIALDRNYGSTDIIGAVLSFAQTAVRFREPDAVYEGRNTGGILPPITAIVRGFGDCDTKTALTSSILSNWPQVRMIGVSVPGHYLMGVLQIPGKRDLFVEYEGLKYVLLEPSGPAWLPPGRVADETVAQLKAGDGFSLHPFF